MPGHYRGRILTVAMVGYALVQMTLVPVTLIMPTLSKGLGVPLKTGSWLLTGYLLAMTAFILPAGRLGDRYGYKRVFLSGLAALTVTCAAVALAPSFWLLLPLRVCQGIACALVNGTALAWVTNAFPASHRGRVVGAVTLASFIGGFTGTYLATWAITHATWVWTFLALVPPGLIALAAGLGIPDKPADATVTRRPVDWTGVIVLAMALITFSLSLNHLHEGAESWADGWRWHLPMHALAAGLLTLFVFIESRAADPILPLHLLRNRAFIAALGANVTLHLPMMGASVVLPFLMQLGMGLTPAHTAAITMQLQIISLVMSPVSGWLYDRSNSRLLLPGSMAVIGTALFMFGLFNISLSFTGLVALATLLGIGMGLFLSANNAALMGSVPAEIRGFASGMLETTRQLGHGVSTTVVGTILSYGVALASGGGTRQALRTGARTSYWFLATLAVAGFLLSVWHVQERRRARQAELPAGAGAPAAGA